MRSRIAATVTAGVLAAAGLAAGGPARADGDAAPAAPPRDAAADCADAATAIRRGDLTRAALLVAACPDDAPVRATLTRALDRAGYARVTVVTKPEGVAVALDTRPDLALRGGDDVWLPAGAYTFSAGGVASTVRVGRGTSAVALLEVPAAAAPTEHQVDFGDEGGGDVVSGPPPKIVHPSLLPDRYQKILAAKGGGGALIEGDDGDDAGGDARADLSGLGVRASIARSSLGAGDAGAGAGGAYGAIVGWSVGATARVGLHGDLFAGAELAWAHRGASQGGAQTFDEIQLPLVVGDRFATVGGLDLAGYVGGAAALRVAHAPATLDVGALGGSALAGLEAGTTGETSVRVDLRAERFVAAGPGGGWAFSLGVGVLFR